MKKSAKKQKKQGEILLFSYFLYYALQPLAVSCMPSVYSRIAAMLLSDLVYMLFIVFMCFGDLVDHMHKSLKNGLKSLKTVLFVVILIFACNILFSFVANLMHLSTSENEIQLMQLYRTAPLYFLCKACIIGPFIEEMIFRYSVHSCFPYPYRIWISSLSFGMMHLISTVLTGNFINLIYIVLYAGTGFILSFAYEQNQNICTVILSHAMYNLFAAYMVMFYG